MPAHVVAYYRDLGASLPRSSLDWSLAGAVSLVAFASFAAGAMTGSRGSGCLQSHPDITLAKLAESVSNKISGHHLTVRSAVTAVRSRATEARGVDE